MEGAAYGAVFALVAKKLGEENAALTSQLKRCGLSSIGDSLLEALHSLEGVRSPNGFKVTASVRFLSVLTGATDEAVRRALNRLSAQDKIAKAGINQFLLFG